MRDHTKGAGGREAPYKWRSGGAQAAATLRVFAWISWDGLRCPLLLIPGLATGESPVARLIPFARDHHAPSSRTGSSEFSVQ